MHRTRVTSSATPPRERSRTDRPHGPREPDYYPSPLTLRTRPADVQIPPTVSDAAYTDGRRERESGRSGDRRKAREIAPRPPGRNAGHQVARAGYPQAVAFSRVPVARYQSPRPTRPAHERRLPMPSLRSAAARPHPWPGFTRRHQREDARRDDAGRCHVAQRQTVSPGRSRHRQCATRAPTSCATAPIVVWAAFKPRRKSSSLYAVKTSPGV